MTRDLCAVINYTVKKTRHYTLVRNFAKGYTVRLGSKFVAKPYLNMPPHLKHVATLPYEISMFHIAFVQFV